MSKSYEEVSELASFEGAVDASERTRLISRKRSKVEIDPSRDFIKEAVQKYYHFYNWLLEKSQDFGSISSFSKYLSTQTGISSGTIQRILSSRDNTKTNVYYINEICSLLNCSLDEAFGLDPKPVSSGFRYDLATYITLMRNAELSDEELSATTQQQYVHTPLVQSVICSSDEEKSYIYVQSCIDREIGFVNKSMDSFISSTLSSSDSTLDKLRRKNLLMPYRFRLIRRDFTNSTSELAKALNVRKEILSFKRICQHTPRIDIIVAFCLIYGVSLDYLLDTSFVFSHIKDSFTRTMLRKLSILDYNVCGVIGKIAILEREGHENLSLGLITSSSVSNKKLKTTFAEEVQRAKL